MCLIKGAIVDEKNFEFICVFKYSVRIAHKQNSDSVIYIV